MGDQAIKKVVVDPATFRARFAKMVADAEQQGLNEQLAAASSDKEREAILATHRARKESSREPKPYELGGG